MIWIFRFRNVEIVHCIVSSSPVPGYNQLLQNCFYSAPAKGWLWCGLEAQFCARFSIQAGGAVWEVWALPRHCGICRSTKHWEVCFSLCPKCSKQQRVSLAWCAISHSSADPGTGRWAQPGSPHSIKAESPGQAWAGSLCSLDSPLSHWVTSKERSGIQLSNVTRLNQSVLWGFLFS